MKRFAEAHTRWSPMEGRCPLRRCLASAFERWRGCGTCRTGGTRRASVSLRQHPYRHVLDTVDEVRAEAADVAGGLHALDAREQLLEHHPHLQPRERGSQAEVRAARAEREMAVRRAPHVEAER